MGVVNAHSRFIGTLKDGRPVTIHGRTTLVFTKQQGQRRIVSAHFSTMPHMP